MADRYPKSLDELAADNEALRADNERLRASLGSAQAAVVAREAEIAGLKKPKFKPRVLNPEAKDRFDRPFR